MADLIAVDDDEMVRDLIGAVVRRGGHAVRVAGDGAGLRRLDAERPAELVLLDKTLPGEDGISLARWLRTARPEIGIVLVSGQGEAVDRIAGLEAGADDYVAKPFAPAELLARIDAVLRRRWPQAARGWATGGSTSRRPGSSIATVAARRSRHPSWRCCWPWRAIPGGCCRATTCSAPHPAALTIRSIAASTAHREATPQARGRSARTRR